MKTYVIIKADTNDADYVTRKTSLSDEEIEIVKKVAHIVKESKSTDWGKRDMRDEGNDPYIRFKDQLTEEEIDFFNDLCPSSEYGIHSLESIELLEITKELELL